LTWQAGELKAEGYIGGQLVATHVVRTPGPVATLKRVDEYRRTVLNKESQPSEIAYLAMALHRLGRVEEAKVTLDQLRDLLKDERFAEDEKAKAYLAEAEKLISGEKQ
jgi:hypothetical protein